jgi:UDP-N-acetylmuramate--alanine ligase
MFFISENDSAATAGIVPRRRADSQAPPGRVHLVGIAGSGMSALGEVLAGRGWIVSGSDLSPTPISPLARLAGEGQGVRARGSPTGVASSGGHCAENVPDDVRLVVASDAVPADNPERRCAAELGVPVLSYFEMVGRLMAEGTGLAVAGTHGKSTTGAMAAEMLVAAGLDPTVLCGAAPLGRATGGRVGRPGGLVLAEACEYRANFLHLKPRQAVILGIEPDHFDCYPTEEELEAAFARFADSLPQEGLLLAAGDCPATRRIARRAACRVETFAVAAEADWSARRLGEHRGRYRFELRRGGRPLADVRLRVPGRHNVQNALAAAALVWHQGVGPGTITTVLGRFAGLRRRLEYVGRFGGVSWVDDYAHHPTEVAAGLATLRRLWPGRRLWCVFQPHQASRTARLLDALAASLHNADMVLVAEIFRAREGPPARGEVTAADLAAQVRASGVEVPAVHRIEEIQGVLRRGLAPGDVLVTMGAGDIRKAGDGIADRFREGRAAG